jgi:hypothetical protein
MIFHDVRIHGRKTEHLMDDVRTVEIYHRTFHEYYMNNLKFIVQLLMGFCEQLKYTSCNIPWLL